MSLSELTPKNTIKSFCTDGKIVYEKDQDFILGRCKGDIVFISSKTLDVEKTISHSEQDPFVAFDCKNGLLLAANKSGFVKLWDLDTSSFRKTLVSRFKNLSDIKISPSGELAALASFKNVVKVISISEGYVKQQLILKNSLNKLFWKDDFTILCCANDGNIIKWDLKTKLSQNRQNHYSAVTSLRFFESEGENLILSSARDKIVTLWKSENLKILKTFLVQEVC
ncbi:hypothetical protein MHBO_001812 [Bonamia ostreae]|uniref:Uncharacterized protein n=1 Tax=Bonamia ostreae TaxID=126728 RepID=A0ABV2AL22_9EUKA